MDIIFQYAYAVLVVPFAVAWVLIFIFSKNTRKEQLIMSILLIPVGPISELIYFQDYWTPGSIFSFSIGPVLILIEDILFLFFIGGIGGVIYEALVGRRARKIKKSPHYLISVPIVIAVVVIVSLGLWFLGVNSIFSTSLGFIAGALLVVSQRKDLFINSLLSGLGVMAIMFVSYFILFSFVTNSEEILQQGWLIYGTRLDMRILGLPLTEMFWGFSWGLLVGPIYEFARKLQLVK